MQSPHSRNSGVRDSASCSLRSTTGVSNAQWRVRIPILSRVWKNYSLEIFKKIFTGALRTVTTLYSIRNEKGEWWRWRGIKNTKLTVLVKKIEKEIEETTMKSRFSKKTIVAIFLNDVTSCAFILLSYLSTEIPTSGHFLEREIKFLLIEVILWVI